VSPDQRLCAYCGVDNGRKTWPVVTITAVAVALLAWMYVSPYLAIRNLKRAAMEGNTDTLRERVDFPALRASLKEEFAGQLSDSALHNINKDDEPFAAIGTALAGGVLDVMIDQFVTPQTIERIVQGKTVEGAPNQVAGIVDRFSQQEKKNEDEARVSSGYESYGRFVVRIFPPQSNESLATLVFLRSEFVIWRLSGIRLPDFQKLTEDSNGAGTSRLQATQQLLPRGATIIESKDIVDRNVGHSRRLVLWMLDAEKVFRKSDDDMGGYCGDYIYGDNWHGRLRLSLVDVARPKLINTVQIRDQESSGNRSEGGDSFSIPFQVSNSYYYVPHVNAKKEGKPEILHLRDLTGEGVLGQFVLFNYEACGIADTTVLGYSPSADAVVQYRIEMHDGPTVATGVWAGNAFAEKPIRPGYWNFVFEPGHGSDSNYHEEVSFDSERQLFVHKTEAIPIPESQR